MAGIIKNGKTYASVNADNYIEKSNIVDNLTSTDTDKPLSANQGKILNDKIISHLTTPYKIEQVSYSRDAIPPNGYLQLSIPYTVPDGYALMGFTYTHLGSHLLHSFGQSQSSTTGNVTLTLYVGNMSSYDVESTTNLQLLTYLYKL